MPWTSQTTAEQVLAVTDGVTSYPLGVRAEEIAKFADITLAQTEVALDFAVELALLKHDVNGMYKSANSLCRFIATRDQGARATVLRIALENYLPFLTFRERWLATADFNKAAIQTALIHQLTIHREAMKETFISLATFSGVFITKGGGMYELSSETIANPLASIAQACSENAAAEQRIRLQLGPQAAEAVSKSEVIDPLVIALQKCLQPDSATHSVVAAANAVESFLFAEGTSRQCNMAVSGVNGKLQALKAASLIPDKLVKVGNYIGWIRNAADHGTDSDIGMSWTVQRHTGIEYVFVSCSFISNYFSYLAGIKGPI